MDDRAADVGEPEPVAVVGSRGQMAPWERRLILFGTAFVVGFVVLAAVRRNVGDLIGAGLFLLVTIVQVMVPPTRITAEAIHRPWRKYSRIPWSEVDHLIQPTLVPYLQVKLQSGKRFSLTDIPLERAAEVAGIGRTTVTGEPIRITPPPTGQKSAQERQADVSREAARLSAERTEMAKRLRPPRG